jgi:hypothetical protein
MLKLFIIKTRNPQILILKSINQSIRNSEKCFLDPFVHLSQRLLYNFTVGHSLQKGPYFKNGFLLYTGANWKIRDLVNLSLWNLRKILCLLIPMKLTLGKICWPLIHIGSAWPENSWSLSPLGLIKLFSWTCADLWNILWVYRAYCVNLWDTCEDFLDCPT